MALLQARGLNNMNSTGYQRIMKEEKTSFCQKTRQQDEKLNASWHPGEGNKDNNKAVEKLRHTYGLNCL